MSCDPENVEEEEGSVSMKFKNSKDKNHQKNPERIGRS